MSKSQNLPSKELKKKLDRALKDLPRMIGVEGVKFFRSNFDKQQFQDDTPITWPKPKRNTPHPTLQVTGNLRRNVRLVSANADKIVWGNDVPYAAHHNQFKEDIVNVRSHSRKSKLGKTFNVRAYSYSLKPRPFMGDSKTFDRIASKTIVDYLRKNQIIK